MPVTFRVSCQAADDEDPELPEPADTNDTEETAIGAGSKLLASMRMSVGHNPEVCGTASFYFDYLMYDLYLIQYSRAVEPSLMLCEHS